jgi:hypothetical protein
MENPSVERSFADLRYGSGPLPLRQQEDGRIDRGLSVHAEYKDIGQDLHIPLVQPGTSEHEGIGS